MADPDTQTLSNESDISIEALTLITGTGNKIGLREILVEANVFEDVFNCAVSAHFLLEDTLNLIEIGPICGQEWIFLRISKPGFEGSSDETSNEKYNLLLRVSKIEKVLYGSERKMNYLLHTTSERFVNSQRDIVAKSYRKVNPEIAITDILKNRLDATIENEWVRKIEESTQAYTFVVPSLRPFEAINFIASKAKNKINGMNDFIFFENADGYHLRSLANLLDTDVALQENRYFLIEQKNKNIVTEDGSTNDLNPFDNIFSPQATESTVLFDQIGSYNRGEFGTNTRVFDLFSSINVVREKSYNDFFKKSAKLNLEPKIPKNDWGEGTYSENYRLFNLNTRPYADTLTTGDVAFSDNVDQFGERVMKFAAINDQRIKLQMPGSSFLKAGTLIFFKAPSAKARNDDDTESYDKYLTGNYLIAAVRHKFTRTQWTSFMEVTKDSFDEALPDHLSQNFEVN